MRAGSGTVFHRPSTSIVRFAFARSRRSALLRPRCRAAGGLDRAIREPLETQLSTASREPLDERAATAVLSNELRAVATRNPLRIARCGADGSSATGHGSFSSLIHSLVGSFARRYVRGSCDRFRTCAVVADHSARSGSAAVSRARHERTRPPREIVTLSRLFACQLSMRTAPHSVLPIHSRTSTRNASTFNMGRRIMAERRRHRRETKVTTSCRSFARTQTPRSTRG